jgi:hypothetical protein
MAEIAQNNAEFYLKEIERITALYNQLLERYLALTKTERNNEQQ